MNNLAIIPARGGSKRIPRKSIKDFLGKPILAYSIEVALQSKLFEEVMVSTDDEEISELAIHYGAKVPFMRSKKNADDFATTMAVISEVKNDYKEKQKKEFENICCIYPAAPLIQVKHLQNGLELLQKNKLTSVSPVVAFGNPIWRGIRIDQSGKTEMIWPEFVNTRSQDLEKVYYDAGQWYWFKANEIDGWEYPNKTGSIILSEEEVQDIDNLSDWKLAEMKFKLLLEKQKSA